MKPCDALTSTAVGRCEQGEAGFGGCAGSAREGEGGFADLAARPKPQVLVIHSRGLSWRNLDLGAPDIAVARDKIVFNLGEHSGNVWMTELLPANTR